MNTPNTSSSGYITEFNIETGYGFIQEDKTNRVLSVQLKSFKSRARRYLTNDNKFIGELFDFDIVVKQKSDGDTCIDTFEAVNVRHRVLKCNVEGCSRIKAFTHVKALEDHINLRHNSQKQKKEASTSTTTTIPRKSKKPRRRRPEPILITLPFPVSSASVGRFIGKQGANLKLFQEKNQVKLQLLDTQKAVSFLQILIKPNAYNTIDVTSISKKLKLEFEHCEIEQGKHKANYERCVKQKHSSNKEDFAEFMNDLIDGTSLKESRINHFERQKLLKRKSRYSESESLVRFQEPHSSLNKEGHRTAATCDMQCRQKYIFNILRPKQMKRSMKEKQWLVNEQLQGLEPISV